MRVVVSGIGVVSPLAFGAGPTFERLLEGATAIRHLDLFEFAELPKQIAASVTLGTEAWPASLGALSRADRMALAAAREALRHAGLAGSALIPGDASGDNSAVHLVMGGSTGGMWECEALIARLKLDPHAKVQADRLRMHPLSAAADRVDEAYGGFREVTPVCSACSSGATAIALAANAIRGGRTHVALAGGVDALCRLTCAGFNALHAISKERCRPFDLARSGLSLGEGAAFLVLESETSARARGVEPVAELAGWAIGAEAHHITHPEPQGERAAAVMRRAIDDAGLAVADVDYVNAHGTATPHNDAMEAAAIHRCFGERATDVWVSSVKGAIGHTLGAAGAIEAAVTCMTVARGEIVPTVGLETIDPACALRHVTDRTSVAVHAAITNAFGFGGNDTVLTFRRWSNEGAAAVSPATVSPAVASPPRAERRVAITGAAVIGPLGRWGGATLSGAACYAEPGPAPENVPLDLPVGELDTMRARRLDRASRMVTIAAMDALGSPVRVGDDVSIGAGARIARRVGSDGSNGRSPDALPSETGIVVGTGHGGVSATGHVLRRIFEKGPRFASPAHFPSVLPSSQAAHPSIYLGLLGPAFACTDLATSAECAFQCALNMIGDGFCSRVIAAAVDEYNEAAAKHSGPLCGIIDRGARSEGATAIVLEPLDACRSRALAEVTWTAAWRGNASDGEGRAGVVFPSPTFPTRKGSAHLLMSRAAQVPSAWASVPRSTISDRAGDHESVGGIALVSAVAMLTSRAIDEALVLGCGAGRGFAWVLRRVAPEPTKGAG